MVTSVEGSVAWLQTFALSGLRYHDHDSVCFDWNLAALSVFLWLLNRNLSHLGCHEGHIMGSNA